MTDNSEQLEPQEQEAPEATLPSDDQPQADVNEPTQTEEQTEEGLPEGVKERTRKRFEQLTEKLKDKAEPERVSVFDALKPKKVEEPQMPQAPQFPQAPDLNQFVDQEGNVDVARYNQAVQQALQVGQMSFQQANAAYQFALDVETRAQERETYQKYEELNPKSESYDRRFTDLVADRMARYLAQGANKPLVEVADEIAELYAKPKNDNKVAKEAVEKYKETVERRQDGPIENGKGNRQGEDMTEVIREMREGNMETRAAALGKRLKAAGL